MIVGSRYPKQILLYCETCDHWHADVLKEVQFGASWYVQDATTSMDRDALLVGTRPRSRYSRRFVQHWTHWNGMARAYPCTCPHHQCWWRIADQYFFIHNWMKCVWDNFIQQTFFHIVKISNYQRDLTEISAQTDISWKLCPGTVPPEGSNTYYYIKNN